MKSAKFPEMKPAKDPEVIRLALAITCNVCGAKPTEWCKTTTTGYRAAILHSERTWSFR